MKKWLTDKFLPMWAKETVLSENQRLWQENERLCRKLRDQEAYIQGMQTGLRALKRINITNRGGNE